jgi:hypothetical protein
MGWQDRDWATPTDDSSQRRVRVVVWTVAVLSVLAAFGFFGRARGHGTLPSPVPKVVYGGATAQDGRLTCTAQGANADLGVWVCTEWTIVQPGQSAAAAREQQGACGVRHVDQGARAWVCDSVKPPDPSSLPRPRVSPATRDNLS